MSAKSSIPPPVTAVIEGASSRLPALLARTEDMLVEVSGAHGPKLSTEALATLRAGGKRLRPLLVLLDSRADFDEMAVRAAVAIELIHMATLVHDDILDAAPLRRGAPTVVAKSGREAATGLGDLLLSRAFHVLAEADHSESIKILSTASVSLARGELAQRADAFNLDLSEEKYLERCRLKTACLFESACLLGQLANGRGREDRAAVATGAFGADVGLAFQLLDDVLDVSGPAKRTGKARGTDLLDGTVTLPLIRAREIARAAADGSEVADWSAPESAGGEGARATVQRALEAETIETLLDLDLRALDPAAAEHLCDAIAATGALEDVRARGHALVASAKRKIASAGHPPSQRRLFDIIADGVVERYS